MQRDMQAHLLLEHSTFRLGCQVAAVHKFVKREGIIFIVYVQEMMGEPVLSSVKLFIKYLYYFLAVK